MSATATSPFRHSILDSGGSHPRSSRGIYLRWPGLLCLLLFSAAAVWGQATTSIRGAVTDPSGAAISGASVTLTEPDAKTERQATTGVDGEYQFTFLPPGTYTLGVTATGFQRFEKTSLVLLVNTPATLNVLLKVGSASEVVTVSTEEPALNLVDASIGNSFDEKQVTQIPLEGRNVPDLLSLQAGVAYTGNRPDIDKDQDTRNGSVNGARSDQSNITLDGVDVNDQANGYAFASVLPVTLDSVQEFRVTTTNYGADQGAGSGAQVALVTKSGSNQFHGAVYEYNRNTLTSANDYLIKRSELNDGLPNKPLKLIRNIFGASLGGPVRKDRLFFFLNYEGTQESEEQSVVRAIPTPSLCQGNVSYLNVNGGVTTLTPTDIKNIDPLHQGINPYVLDLSGAKSGYFNKTFCTGQFTTNDTSVGDGLNYSGYRFRAPVSLDNNAFIARVDYHLTSDGKHTIFWRGNLQNLHNPQAPFLPGTAPEQTVADHSKGFALGYTAVISSTMANSFHWGFTRQSYGAVGDSNQPWNFFLGLDQGVTYSHNLQVPIHNLADDFSWTKGKHTIQLGGNLAFARNPRTSYLHSFSEGLGTTNWTSPIGFADTASPLDPSVGGGFPEVDPNSYGARAMYDRPMMALLGMVSDVVANYNYDKQNALLGQGTPVSRRYGMNWYEFYGQDTWRVKPNLTVTYGLRWSLFPPPWEVNGLQTTSTFSLGKQFDINAANMKKGLGYSTAPVASFVPGGPANNAPGFYHFEKSDFAPRISVAYSPRFRGGFLQKLFGDGDKTSIRGGFSKVYDRAGFQLLNTFDANAPAGYGWTLQNPCCTTAVTASTMPRVQPLGANPLCPQAPSGLPAMNSIPCVNQSTPIPVVVYTAPPLGGFPQTPNQFAQANLWVSDDTLKTPHAYAIDFSIERALPQRFTLQFAYVGRFGGHLLTQRDLNQPLDIVDPKTGIDYYAAATALSKLARAGLAANQKLFSNYADYQKFVMNITDAQLGPTAAYWKDMFTPSSSYQNLYPGSGMTGMTAPQAAFDMFYNPNLSYIGNEIVGIADSDIYGYLGNSSGNSIYFSGPNGELGNNPGNFLSNQAISMYAWSSVGNSNYNALQATLRKQFSHGVQFDLNYTYSKSIDITSSAARVGYSLVGYQNIGLLGSKLSNAFFPNLNRAVSDYDLTHQINANWIAALPFGKGQPVARNAGGLLNAFIGGWQLSGLARWTTGLPVSIDNGQNWPTDWQYTGLAQMISKAKTGVFRNPTTGAVTLFPDPAAAQADFTTPFPGGTGSRNVLRADGYASWDMSLSKRWGLPLEGSSLQFRWEVFNVANLTRFNAQTVGSSIPSLQQAPSQFGTYGGLLTEPRVMQFALRLEF